MYIYTIIESFVLYRSNRTFVIRLTIVSLFYRKAKPIGYLGIFIAFPTGNNLKDT